jgi:Sulfotransferase domain
MGRTVLKTLKTLLERLFMRLPNFLLAGFEKCGTTSIYNYLNQHSQIYMSPVKEPNFLERDWNHFIGTRRTRIDTLEKYQQLFAQVEDHHLSIGEASPNLLFHFQDSIPQIKKYVPDAKIIAVLRDPVERAYSDYLMLIRDEIKGNDRSLMEQLQSSPHSSYTLRKGLYYQPVQQFLDQFGNDRFQVFLYEDFARDTLTFMQKIYEYLEVKSDFVPDVSQKNQVSEVPRFRSINKMLRTSNPLRNFIATGLRLVMPVDLRQNLRSALLNLNAQDKSARPLSDQERSALSQYYYDDVLRLQDLIQRDLSHWTPLRQSPRE